MWTRTMQICYLKSQFCQNTHATFNTSPCCCMNDCLPGNKELTVTLQPLFPMHLPLAQHSSWQLTKAILCVGRGSGEGNWVILSCRSLQFVLSFPFLPFYMRELDFLTISFYVLIIVSKHCSQNIRKEKDLQITTINIEVFLCVRTCETVINHKNK